MSKIFGAVADDDAGAAELAGMLADRGMRPILILDELWRADFETWTRDADAVVFSTASRTAPRDVAFENTRRAIRLLESIDPQVLQVSYSSTAPADSNYGSSIDAAMDETHEEFTVALPHVSSSGQSTAAHLLAQLQTHSKRRAELVSSSSIVQGPARIRELLARLRANGIEIAILDFASEENLPGICEAISDLHLVTGSPALARYLPSSWTRTAPVYPQRRVAGRGFLVVAGSNSPVTRSQNAWLASHHAVAITLDAMNLATGTMPDSVITPISEELASGGTCLLQMSLDTQRVHDSFREQNKTASQAEEAIARNLATFVRDIMRLINPEGLIVAGSETAAILARLLGFGALAVGPTIEPGIPVCVTLSESTLPVVLKPGELGTETFYHHALNAIRSLEVVNEH